MLEKDKQRLDYMAPGVVLPETPPAKSFRLDLDVNRNVKTVMVIAGLIAIVILISLLYWSL